MTIQTVLMFGKKNISK